MVYNVGHIKYEETTTENIGDNFVDAYYIPARSIRHRKPTLQVTNFNWTGNKVHFINFQQIEIHFIFILLGEGLKKKKEKRNNNNNKSHMFKGYWSMSLNLINYPTLDVNTTERTYVLHHVSTNVHLIGIQVIQTFGEFKKKQVASENVNIHNLQCGYLYSPCCYYVGDHLFKECGFDAWGHMASQWGYRSGHATTIKSITGQKVQNYLHTTIDNFNQCHMVFYVNVIMKEFTSDVMDN